MSLNDGVRRNSIDLRHKNLEVSEKLCTFAHDFKKHGEVP